MDITKKAARNDGNGILKVVDAGEVWELQLENVKFHQRKIGKAYELCTRVRVYVVGKLSVANAWRAMKDVLECSAWG